MKKTLTAIVLIVLVVSVVLGVFYFVRSNGSLRSLEEVSERVIDTLDSEPTTPTSEEALGGRITFLHGVVSQVLDSTITVSPLSQEQSLVAYNEIFPSTVEIQTNSQTVFSQERRLTAEEFEQVQIEYNTALNELGDRPALEEIPQTPNQTVLDEVDMTALRVGDGVIVSAADNILGMESFEAVSIVIKQNEI